MRIVCALIVGWIGVGWIAWPLQEHPPAEAILRRVDEAMHTESSRATVRMRITYEEGDTREKVFQSWSLGDEKTFIEFIEPARDRGTRYLKIEQSMWIFMPRIRKSILIKGHMLRQGMMGSDFSYEDATETSDFLEDYDGSFVGVETWDGREVFVLDLVAKRRGVTYYRIRVFVDTTYFLPLKEELYAQSGKLLKVLAFSDIQKFGNRYFPTLWQMRNMLRKNTETTMELTQLEIDVPIPETVFTRRHLER